MPGVPSSPSDGPRASGDDDRPSGRPARPEEQATAGDPAGRGSHGDGPGDPDIGDHAGPEDDAPDPGDGETGLPHRLWTSVLVAAVLTWLVVGALLSLLAVAGAPVPPATADARSALPWVPQDVWSVAADAGWIATVSFVAGWFLRNALERRRVRPLPALPDVAVIVGVGVVVSAVVWPQLFPEVSFVFCVAGAMLLTILLLRVREVWVGRDVLSPWRRRISAAVGLVLLLLVAPYAAWHPLSVQGVEVDATGQSSVSGGDGSGNDLNAGDEGGTDDDTTYSTRTNGDTVRVSTGPGRTVTLEVDLLAGSGGVRLLDVRPVVPGGAFVLLPPRPVRSNGSWLDGAPLPRRLDHRADSPRTFRLRARGRCDGRKQRIDRLRVRYERLGSTVTTELATDAPVTLSCTGR